MSRIYEALQKAESERKLERRELDLRIPEQTASGAMGATAALAEPEDAVLATSDFPEYPSSLSPTQSRLHDAGWRPGSEHRFRAALGALPAAAACAA